MSLRTWKAEIFRDLLVTDVIGRFIDGLLQQLEPKIAKSKSKISFSLFVGFDFFIFEGGCPNRDNTIQRKGNKG